MDVACALALVEIEVTLGEVFPGRVLVLTKHLHLLVFLDAFTAYPSAAFSAVGVRLAFFLTVFARPRLLVLRLAERAKLCRSLYGVV